MVRLSIEFLWNCENENLGNLSFVIAPEQSRAARGLLAWSQQELAQRASVGVVTVHQLEAGVESAASSHS